MTLSTAGAHIDKWAYKLPKDFYRRSPITTPVAMMRSKGCGL